MPVDGHEAQGSGEAGVTQEPQHSYLLAKHL